MQVYVQTMNIFWSKLGLHCILLGLNLYIAESPDFIIIIIIRTIECNINMVSLAVLTLKRRDRTNSKLGNQRSSSSRCQRTLRLKMAIHIAPEHGNAHCALR